MEKNVFSSSQVAHIVRITGRQVVSWTEKGVIEPFKDSTGTGVKREYNYTNLLEFGLCKTLFSIGLNFRTVKMMINEVRKTGVIRAWAEDFQNYYQAVMDRFRKILSEFSQEMKENSPEIVKGFDVIVNANLQGTVYKPENPEGVIAFFFIEGSDSFNTTIYPWETDYVIKFNEVKEGLAISEATMLINIGRIKHQIDKRLP
ncbi:MAG: MerR family transcriptional regulator [Thermotogota bacterium]|jgi:DNA-binding transcriptional MerR regulator|nr:MerR family transcriptional regulator [Thermotogota bacterium]